MAQIGVEHAAAGLELHSCATCGAHAWRSRGRPVDRQHVLAALQVRRPAATPARGRPAAPPQQPADDDARRVELQRLLDSFTVHGSSS